MSVAGTLSLQKVSYLKISDHIPRTGRDVQKIGDTDTDIGYSDRMIATVTSAILIIAILLKKIIADYYIIAHRDTNNYR